MPRLSLYKPQKGNDFRFLDRVINEQFQVGGTEVFVHKYIGPLAPTEGEATPSTPVNTNPIPELGIQDLIFLENRDRKYEKDVYIMRGIYTMQDIDFNLSQFGFFLTNDNVMITFHLRASMDLIGRKLMPGDVLELPHLRDEYALSDSDTALRKYYVITDVARPATGYSQTWYPHLIRAKCEPLTASQEFRDIFENEDIVGDGTGLGGAGSGDPGNQAGDMGGFNDQYNTNIEINNQIIAQAEADSPYNGFDLQGLYILPTSGDRTLADVADASIGDVDASSDDHGMDASSVFVSPEKDVYVSYQQGDGIPPNGAPYTFGIDFPLVAAKGSYHLRTDYMPNRLFRFSGTKWVYVETDVRVTLTNKPEDGLPAPRGMTRHNLIGEFINNNNTATIAGSIVEERQSLSKALKKRQRPQADL